MSSPASLSLYRSLRLWKGRADCPFSHVSTQLAAFGSVISSGSLERIHMLVQWHASKTVGKPETAEGGPNFQIRDVVQLVAWTWVGTSGLSVREWSVERAGKGSVSGKTWVWR